METRDIINSDGTMNISALAKFGDKLKNNKIDLMADFKASGSNISTTGSINASSNILTLDNKIDFKDGQGIMIYGAGSQCNWSQPTNVAVSQVGTAGTSTYGYRVATINLTGAVTAATTEVTTSTGNANLDKTNYNNITFTSTISNTPIGYVFALWRTKVPAGSSLQTGFIGYYIDGTSCYDNGVDVMTPPDWIPSTPPDVATREPLCTSIVSGGGTTALVLKDNAIGIASTVKVIHDDTLSLQLAMNSLSGSGGTLFIPNGNYNIRHVQPCSNLAIIGDMNTNIYQIDTQRMGVFDNLRFPLAANSIHNLYFRRLNFYGCQNTAKCGVYYQEAIRLQTVQNIWILECTVQNFLNSGTSLSDSRNIWIKDNQFYNNGAVYSNAVAGTNSSGNSIDITSTINDPANMKDIAGNYFIENNVVEGGPTAGIVIQAFASNKNRAVITGNVVRDFHNWAGIYVECGWGQQVIIENNHIYDCSTGIGVSDTSDIKKFETQISDYIVSNNIIKCDNSINVDVGINIEGSFFNVNNNLVKLSGEHIRIDAHRSTALPTKQFNISDNTFVSTDTSLTPALSAYITNVNTGTINNNKFLSAEGCYNGGVWIDGLVKSTVNGPGNLKISNNLIKGCSQMGLRLQHMINCQITGNTIQDWGISSVFTRYGLYALDCSNLEICGGNVIRDTRSTIYADADITIDSSCSNITIEGNVLGQVLGGNPGSTISGINGTNNVIVRNNVGFVSNGTFVPAINPPVSGTMYQSPKTSYDIEIFIPVFAASPGTAGTVTVNLNSTSTAVALYTEFVNGATTSATPHIIKLRVPAGWYFGVTVSGCTIGNATCIMAH